MNRTAYSLVVVVPILVTREATEVRALTLVLLAELTKRTIRAVLRLTRGWSGCVEVGRLWLTEVRRGSVDVLRLGGGSGG